MMPTLTFDGVEVTVPASAWVLQACGEIARTFFHEIADDRSKTHDALPGLAE